MIGRALVFAGTTEGRRITEFLARNGIKVTVSMATEYGMAVIEESENVRVDSIRGVMEMAEEMREYDVVVDATHPYAVRKSAHIKEACDISGCPLIRITRPGSTETKEVVTVPDTKSAAEYLACKSGNILVATGSNELAEFTSIPGYKERVFARVLSIPSVAEKCSRLGFEGKNLICMEGPFSEELNYAMLKHVGAEYLVTKDSGSAGGFDEKIAAASRAGVKVIVIGRPTEKDGVSPEEAEELLSKIFSIRDPSVGRRLVTIAGIGIGNTDGITFEVLNAIADADLAIGASRMLGSVDVGDADKHVEYRSEKIADYIDGNPRYRKVVVLMSGDTGYYSGAKGLIGKLDREKYDVRVLPGISSVSYFFSRIGSSWDDVFLTSAHGRDCNLVGLSKRHRKVFTLLSGGDSVRSMCSDLIKYDLRNVTVTVGQDLGSPEEKITVGKPYELADREFGELCVALIENMEASDKNPISMPDEDFIRGDAPMTKSEIRSLSVAKLKLCSDSVVYDVGAGTGSVSVEMASVAVSGRVFAIEKDESAASLISLNCKKFGTPNVTVVKGEAPEAMAELPAPTHAFIGGSTGKLKDIVDALIEKNPKVRIVITSVTLETLAETVRCMKDPNVFEEETLCVNISKARMAGSYHLMTAQNPVYITVCRGSSP